MVNNMMFQLKKMRLLGLVLVAMMSVAMISCKKDSKDEPSYSINGNVSTPTWAVSDEYDMPSSMTVTTKVDLSISYASQAAATGWTVTADDLLAAFDGENCIGLAKAKDGLFYLYVTAPKSGSNVTLKYYSAKLKSIFRSEQTLVYRNEGIEGTVAKPYTPSWIINK